MSSKRCREPLPPQQPGKTNWLERHKKSQKSMVAGDKHMSCDRRWDEMDNDLLICVMRRTGWFANRLSIAICKSWVSPFLEAMFHPREDVPGHVLDLRFLDDLRCINSIKFYHYLKLHLDRCSPNRYTKLILCECILPYKVYSAIAQRLPSVKSFESPAKMSFRCCYAKETYRLVAGDTSPYTGNTASFNFVSRAMCRYWKNLETVQCHYSMLWSLSDCKSIRKLTVIGDFGPHPSWLQDCLALAIGKGFPLLDRLTLLLGRVTLAGMAMILEGHKNLTYLDMKHTECVPEEAMLIRWKSSLPNYTGPKDLSHRIARVQTFLTWDGKKCPNCTHLYSRLL